MMKKKSAFVIIAWSLLHCFTFNCLCFPVLDLLLFEVLIARR